MPFGFDLNPFDEDKKKKRPKTPSSRSYYVPIPKAKQAEVKQRTAVLAEERRKEKEAVRNPGWRDELSGAFKEAKSFPGAVGMLAGEVGTAGYKDVRNALPGKDPFPYAMKRDPKTGKMVVARNKDGSPIRTSGHLAESIFGLGDVMATETARLGKDVLVAGLADKPTRAIVKKIDRGAGEKLDYKARQAEWRIAHAPVSAITTVFGGAGVASKAFTIPVMAKRMAALNPGLPSSTARIIAAKELRNPGYAKAYGIRGGLPERLIDGEVRGRPWSRTPGGRTGQRLYDAVSRQVNEVNPNMPFSSSRRAASAQRRRAAQIQKGNLAGLTRAEMEIGDVLEGISGRKPSKARVRSVLGIRRPIRERAEALIAALEGPQDASIRESVTARIGSLEETLRRSAELQPLADEMKVLRRKFDNALDDETRAEVGAHLREVTARLDLSLGRRVERVSGSTERVNALRVFQERFGKRKADALIKVTDAVARSQNPTNPKAWYTANLAEVTSEEAASFVNRVLPTAAQYQTSAGWRYGLAQPRYHAPDPEEAIQLLRDEGGALGVNGKYGDSYFFHKDNTGPTGFIYQNGRNANHWTEVTEDDMRSILHNDAEDILHDPGAQLDELAQALEHRGETPVFFSPLQRAVDDLPGNATKAQSLKAKLKKDVSQVEWDIMGLDEFFARYKGTDKVPHEDLNEYLSDPLNAYNLDELVFSSSSPTNRTRWGDDHQYVLTYKKPSADEPYYELVMALGRTPAGKGGFTHLHWEGIDNPIVHVRFHEIVDNDGKRAIVIDEIQSDWHSDWRKSAANPRPQGSPEEIRDLEIIRENLLDEKAQLQSDYPALVDLENLSEDFNDAFKAERAAFRAIDDWPGGDPRIIEALENSLNDAQQHLTDLRQREIDIFRDAPQAVHDEYRRLGDVLSQNHVQIAQLRDGLGGPPPWELGDTERSAAVRRMMRWAHDSDIDRIVIAPGEVQAIRNLGLRRTPSGKRMADPELDYQAFTEDWKEFQGMDPDALRAFARSQRDDKDAPASTFFRLYEETYPALFEKLIGHKGQWREGIINGRLADQYGDVSTPDHPMSAWTIDLGEEGRRRASIPMRQFQRQPDWDGLPRGATEMLADGRRAMRLFEEADVDTVIHELAHVALPDIDNEARGILERHYGGAVGTWTEQQHEAFARGFENYFRTGRAANVQLAVAFTQIAKWMRQVWRKLTGGEAEDFNLHPEVAAAYDRILGYRGVPTLLDKTERSQVKSQIQSLTKALDQPLESDEFAHALAALEALSEHIEAAGEKILVDHAKPELAAAIKEGLNKRRNLMTTHMAEQGVIDWTPETRARGYFPQTSIWDIQGIPQAQPVRMAAVQDVVGTPRLENKAVMRKPNRLIRYSTGEVLNDPAVLVRVLRARLRYIETLSARNELWDKGKPITKGQEIPRGVALVRNPNVTPEKIADDIYAALRLPPERYSELEMRGKMDDIDEHDVVEDVASDFIWMPSMSGPKPNWVSDTKNVRTVPLGVARGRLGDVFSAAPRGPVMGAVGTANALARLSAIYLPFGGARYITRNAAQNAVMMALTRPSALGRIGRRHSKYKQDHPDDYNRILGEGGTILGTALPEFNIRPKGRSQEIEQYITERTGASGSYLGKFADNPFRWSQWTKHAEDYGYRTTDDWHRLLTDPELQDVRETVMQRTRDDLIDFDALTPVEKEVFSRIMFLWPFIRGITKWPFMFAREYPLRVAAVGALPKAEEQDLGTGAVRESLMMAGRNFGWLDPTGPSLENIERGVRIAKGGNEVKLSAIADMLAPHWREIIQSLSDRQGKTWKQSLANTYVPFASTVNALKRGGTPLDQLDRFLGQSTEPPMSVLNQRKERSDEINHYLDEMENRGLTLGDEGMAKLGTAHNAYEKYKELSARVSFGLRDQGKDPSLGRDSPNHRLRAAILFAVVDEFYPGALNGAMPNGLKDYDRLNAESRKIFYRDVEKGLWGPRSEFLKAAKKEFGEQ